MKSLNLNTRFGGNIFDCVGLFSAGGFENLIFLHFVCHLDLQNDYFQSDSLGDDLSGILQIRGSSSGKQMFF